MKYIIIIVLFFSVDSFAQGFCSLRNPQAKIKALFPSCDNYRTIISTINESSRKELNKTLPFPIHYYEMGRHNLYVIKDKEGIGGLIHARSEQSKWGLVEIVWSLNLDLTIKDYTFQRCRTSSKIEVLKPEITALFIGKSFYDLLENPPVIKPEWHGTNKETLLKLLYKSALKTIALTDICWNDKLSKYRLPQDKSADSMLSKGGFLYSLYREGSKKFVKISQKKYPELIFICKLKSNQIDSLYTPISTRINLNTINGIKTFIKLKFGSKL